MAFPSTFDANGYTGFTRDELVAYWTAKFKLIYGNDINLDSDSPDGQLMNIVVQAQLDTQDKTFQVNASMDPDQAIGVTLDQRVSINGIQRQGGSFSKVGITLVASSTVNLNGIDALIDNPAATVYTIQDGAGTLWQLLTSVTLAAGSWVLTFQAVNPGKVMATAGTIVNPVTIVVGVLSVTNVSAVAAPNLGVDEEPDSVLRFRRQKSVSISAQGVHDAMVAALLNITGITYARVYENDTGSPKDINGNDIAGTDPNAIPRNSIWVVVSGPTDATTKGLIAQAIYTKRNTGCGMKGATQSKIVQADLTNFYVYFDYVAPERTYITFNAHSINGIDLIDPAYIKAQLALNFVPAIGGTMTSSGLVIAVGQIDPNCDVTNVFFSNDNATWVEPLAPTSPKYQFTVAAGDIGITVLP